MQQVYYQRLPSPLYRARAIEKALVKPAKIYYTYWRCCPRVATTNTAAEHHGFIDSGAGAGRDICYRPIL
jgi:predicted alternative tryptophan synthase beta-subunit